MKKLLISFAIFSILFMPIVSLALAPGESSLVPCGTQTTMYPKGSTLPTGGTATDDTALVSNPCGFNDVIRLVNNIIHFILFDLAIPIVAIMFVYAGVLLVFSGGEPGKRTKAKDIFLNALIGLVLAVACYIIVKTILLITGGFSYAGTFF